MRHIKKKISKIIEEIISYFFACGITEFHIDIKEESDQYKLIFNCINNGVDQIYIDKLVKALNVERAKEVEEYYWELTGDNEIDTELNIIGAMVDQFELNVNNDIIELIIYRYK